MKLGKKLEYDNNMDKETIELCNVINSVKGLETEESCCGHGKESFIIFFMSYSDKGLFFLSRCVNHRYWKYGHLWNISMEIGDDLKNGKLPISYVLSSNKVKGKEAYKQAKDLVENMNYHLNHVNFKKLFGYDENDFYLS